MGNATACTSCTDDHRRQWDAAMKLLRQEFHVDDLVKRKPAESSWVTLASAATSSIETTSSRRDSDKTDTSDASASSSPLTPSSSRPSRKSKKRYSMTDAYINACDICGRAD